MLIYDVYANRFLRRLGLLALIGILFINGVNGETLFVHTDKPAYFVSEKVHFKIYAILTQTGQSPESPSRIAYLELLDRKNNPVIQWVVSLTNGMGNGSFELPEYLLSDHYTLRCYTSWMRNFGEDGFFHKSLTIFNAFPSIVLSGVNAAVERTITFEKPSVQSMAASLPKFNISATSDRKHYGKRERISMTLFTQDSRFRPIDANLSVSVYRVDELQQEDAYTIQDLVTGSISGSGEGGAVTYLPELEGPIITGKIVDAYTGDSRSRIAVSLSSVGDASVFCVATSDELGNLMFNPPVMRGLHECVLQVLDTGATPQILLSSPFHETFIGGDLPDFRIEPSRDSLFNEYRVLVKLQHSFSRYDTIRTGLTSPFYGVADKTYYLDDYTSFPTLRDIFREYVLEVAPRGSGEDITLKVLNRQEGYMFERNPLILYDGVPVTQVAKLMEINPKEIEKIDIVTSRYHFGDFEYEGILSFFSHGRNFHSHLSDDQTLILDIQGTADNNQVPTIAYDQDYPARLPDLRNVLYWNPHVSIDGTGSISLEFFTSDVVGKFVAIVQGIDASGRVGYASFQFDVN